MRVVVLVAMALFSVPTLSLGQSCTAVGLLDAASAGTTKVAGQVRPADTSVVVVVRSADALVRVPVQDTHDGTGRFEVALPFSLSSAHTVALLDTTGCKLAGPLAVHGGSAAPEKRLTTEWTRLTVGIDTSGRAAQSRSWNFLVDVMLTAPAWREPKCQDEREAGEAPSVSAGDVGATRARARAERTRLDCQRSLPRVSTFLNARLSGVPQDGSIPVQQFVGGFTKDLLGGTTTGLLQGLQLTTGVEWALMPTGWRFDQVYAFQPHLIVGTGFTAAPNPTDVAPVFELNADARSTYNVPADTAQRSYKYIAFMQPDRSTFLGQWFAGFRFKTHHFRSTESPRRVNFPGMVDVTIGQNAAVQGGRMVRGLEVFRLEAFYPLPLDRGRSVYLFGTALKLLRNGNEQPALVLRGAQTALSGDDVFRYTLTPEDRRRDFWSFGVAVDLINLFTTQDSGK